MEKFIKVLYGILLVSLIVTLVILVLIAIELTREGEVGSVKGEIEMRYVDRQEKFMDGMVFIYEQPSEKKYYAVSVSNWEYNNPEEVQLTGQFKVAGQKLSGYLTEREGVFLEGEWRMLLETSYKEKDE